MSGGRGAQLCSCQCHWNLSWLRFGSGKIAVSDVDGLFVVERGNKFLFIETKRLDEILSDGQKLLLFALSKLPSMTVWLVRGPQSYPQAITIIKGGQWSEPEETNREQFQTRVDAWYEKANAFIYR